MNTDDRLRRSYRVVKRVLPLQAAEALRAGFTAFATPIAWTVRTGHWLSSLTASACTRSGAPLPWYTYPAIDFLNYRRAMAKRVLEFGAGHSTLWWGRTARYVLALESDPQWVAKIRARVNEIENMGSPHEWMHAVDVHEVAEWPVEDCVSAVSKCVDGADPFDVVVIDGLQRVAMVPIALKMRAPNGIIIVDNAEGYGLWNAMRDSGLSRVDFCGQAPGVLRPHCTSIYFSAAAPHPWFAA